MPDDSAAPHFYKRRPIHLCTDDRPADDEGPPNWMWCPVCHEPHWPCDVPRPGDPTND